MADGRKPKHSRFRDHWGASVKANAEKDAVGKILKPATRHTWDTNVVRAEDRFDYYREGICQTFLSMTPDVPPGKIISARIETFILPEGSIDRVRVSPHTLSRTESDLTKMNAEFFYLGFNLSGEVINYSRKDVDCRSSGGLYFHYSNQVSSFHAMDQKDVVFLGINIPKKYLPRRQMASRLY